MNIDFSTITPAGVIALGILCISVSFLIISCVRKINKLNIQTKNFTIETEKKINEINSGSLAMSRDIIKKQSNLAKHHILNIAGDLRSLFSGKYDLAPTEETIVWLLVSLFTAELKYQVLNNFTENHIGNNDAEIETYARMRAREYTAYAESFFDDFDWTIRQYRLKEALDTLPPDYLYTKLVTIYKDGKAIEKQVKN